ncbi:MAG: hypothetical protein V1694_00315 [Candidatus Eisenbacteria bacterium]
MCLQSSSLRNLLVVSLIVVFVAAGASVASAAITLSNQELHLTTDQEAVGKPGNTMISIGDKVTDSVDVVNTNYAATVVTADMTKFGGPASLLLGVTPRSDWPRRIFYPTIPAPPAPVPPARDWNPVWDATLGAFPCVSPFTFKLRATHTFPPMVTGNVYLNPAGPHTIGNQEWRVYWNQFGTNDWDYAVPYPGVALGARNVWPLAPNTYKIAADVGGDYDIWFVAQLFPGNGVEFPRCDAPLPALTCDYIYFATLIGPSTGETYSADWIVQDAGEFWVDNTPALWYPGDRSNPGSFVKITASDASGSAQVDIASGDMWRPIYPPVVPPVDIPVTAWDTHDLVNHVNPANEFDEARHYTFDFVLDNSGLGMLLDLPDEILNPANVYYGHPADVVTTILDLTGLDHNNGNDDVQFVQLRLGVIGYDPEWQEQNLQTLGYYGVHYPNDPGSPWEFTWKYPVVPATAPAYTRTDSPAGRVVELVLISDSGDELRVTVPTNKLPAIDNIIPADGGGLVTGTDIVFTADMDNAGLSTELNPVSYQQIIADQLMMTIDLNGLGDFGDVDSGGYVFGDFTHIGWNLSAPPYPDAQPYWISMEQQLVPNDKKWASLMTDVVANTNPAFQFDDNGVASAPSRMLVVDNAGNCWLSPSSDQLVLTNLIPPVDNKPPIVICGSGNFFTGFLYDNTGNNIANCNGPVNDIHGGLFITRDEIVLYANAAAEFTEAELKQDPISHDVATDAVVIVDVPYCVPTPLWDNGTDGHDLFTHDGNFTGSAFVIPDLEIDPYCGKDLTDLGFSVVITDNSGNKSLHEACAGLGVSFDNVIPTLHQANITIGFYDDPGTSEIEGDVNGDGIVSQDDVLMFTWNASAEGVPDVAAVKVKKSSIDPDYVGELTLTLDPAGGVWRSAQFTVPPGSLNGAPLQAAFNVWDDANNSWGYEVFNSTPLLTMDNTGPVIDPTEMTVTVSPTAALANIGSVIGFSYTDDPAQGLTAVYVNVSDVAPSIGTLELTLQGLVWAGQATVEKGNPGIDTEGLANYRFEYWAEDAAGNQSLNALTPAPGINIDNNAPGNSCANAFLRLWEHVNNVAGYVNAGDGLAAMLFEKQTVNPGEYDIVSITADFTSYAPGVGVVAMVPNYGGMAHKWGYSLDPIPAGTLDQPAGGMGTMVKVKATDDAGNVTEVAYCPMYWAPATTDQAVESGDLACDEDCLRVDTDVPEPPLVTGVTFELLESSNNIANVGDRLSIIVNMGDPTAPGYDMNGSTARVQADIGQYGAAYADLDHYLFLADDGFSAFGEGDGRFSYYFFYEAEDGDGKELVEGAPILPGGTDVPPGDATRIRLRAMDDAGNFSAWINSGVLMSAETGSPVAVDNEIPVVDPNKVTVTFADNDHNGICDIGDDVTVTVDMTGAAGGPIFAAYAHLYDWGYPSPDIMIPLEADDLAPAIFKKIFRVGANPGDFLANQPDGPVGFEDEGTDLVPPGPIPHPDIEVIVLDVSDNWSNYKDTDPPYVDPAIPYDNYQPVIDSWPFVWAWPDGITLSGLLADTDDPDPVNPTFRFPSIPASGVQAVKLVDGRIGLQLFYRLVPRNKDVKEFYVYDDRTTPGSKPDWTTYRGQAIPAGSVPASGLGGSYEWISDPLPERADDPATELNESDYHFGVLAVDNADNKSDASITWITGISADTNAPMAKVEAYFTDDLGPCVEEGQPTNIGGDNAYFLGYLDEASEYINVAYAELWARIKDVDPLTQDNQPGPWKVISDNGQWPPDYPLPTAPYRFDTDGFNDQFGDLTQCATFDLAVVAWDEAGNHSTPDQCFELYPFSFTYDTFEPMITMFAINGNPSPYDMELADSARIEVTAMDQCPVTGSLTYRLYLTEMGGQDMGMGPFGVLLAHMTLPVGQPFTYTWDLKNYPAGAARVNLFVCDQAGNSTSHFKQIQVIDQDAPGGVFASIRRDGFSHPYDTRLLDGMSIPGSKDLGTIFWVQWPEEVSFDDYYDVGQVKLEYRLNGLIDGVDSLGDWNTLGVQTSYDPGDVLFSHDDDGWIPYLFEWDSSILKDGYHIDLRATVMDEVGNTEAVTINVVVAAEAPILALSIPEAQDVCGEKRAKGVLNIIGTELPDTKPIDTYSVSYIIKRHDYPDLDDCNWLDGEGWLGLPNIAMIEDGTTSETIWRGQIDPATFWVMQGVQGLEDGAYDIALVTVDVAGNWSCDKNGDGCVDAGYFGECVADSMGMTVVLQNEAPEIRIRSINDFAAIDEGGLWPQPAYVQIGDQVTVTSWTASTCDIAKVEYFLEGDAIINHRRLVYASTNGTDGYMATFPDSGGIGQYLKPGALQNGYVKVDLKAVVTDLLGNVTEEIAYSTVPIWILDTSPACAFVTNPAPGSYVKGILNLTADVLDDDEVYDITYQWRSGEGDWTTIATTRPDDGQPWDTDVNGDDIEWSTDLLVDGAYELRAVARDDNLNTCDDLDSRAITVHVDNTPPTVDAFTLTPTYEPGSVLPTTPDVYIGGPHVEMMAEATDDGMLDHVHFMYKSVDADLNSAIPLRRDDQAPYAYDWTTGFTQIQSGWYDMIFKVEDKAGNETYSTRTVYVDQWAPYGWIGQINSDVTPDGSNYYGVITIHGVSEDNVPESQCMNGHNQKFDSGLKKAQFQYQPVVNGGGYLGGSMSEPGNGQGRPSDDGWIDLGGPVVGAGPDYSINWDTGTLVDGEYYLRVVGVDNVDNRADVDGAPSLPYVTICIVDQIAPKAIIAGVDDVSGYIWATTDTHGQGQTDIDFVRFEYKAATVAAEWTVIGDGDTEICDGLYGVPWHFEPLAGGFWVRAVAYDNDYNMLFDQDPAMMFVTIANHKVTMQGTNLVSSLTRWGNLDDYDEIAVKAVCASGQPSVIVVYDSDPEDHFNAPWAMLLDLERPDNPAEWVDAFTLNGLGGWGNVTIIAAYNNAGTVGAKTKDVKLFKVTDNEGTKGAVSQDSMTVNIPSGAVWFPTDGMIVINIPNPTADPSLEELVPVGDTRMFSFLDHGWDNEDEYHTFEFDNGMKASVTLSYAGGTIPAGTSEENLRVARWCGYCSEWECYGITNVTVNPTAKTVSFKTTHTGAFAVVAGSTLRITQPVYWPSCVIQEGQARYTGRWPSFYSTIEDLLCGSINEDEIKVVLDGPSTGLKLFDNMIIYYDGTAADGIDATYDDVSHNLYVSVDPTWDWEDYWHGRGGGIWKGLPAGTYTVKISAANSIGDKKSITSTITVDAAPPTVDFVGAFVGANPSFTLHVSDDLSGVDLATLFVDVWAVKGGTWTFIGTFTPSAMTFDEESGTVTADLGDMVYGKILDDETSIGLTVYDGFVCVGDECDGPYSYSACDQVCRHYPPDHGVADCAGNHANPVWRSFAVDATPPVMTLISDESDRTIEVRVEDSGSGIDPTGFTVLVDGVETDYEFVPMGNYLIGTLKFDVGDGADGVVITATDVAGNFSVLAFPIGKPVLVVTVISYPNPFDPWKGEYATISFDLSKGANVTIKIYDFAGEPVVTVADRWFNLGESYVNWLGTDEVGKPVATGAYIGHVKADDGSKVVIKNIKIGVVNGGND